MIVLNFRTFRATTAYMGQATQPDAYLSYLGFNFTRLFAGLMPEQAVWLPFFAVPLTALSLYAIYHLVRRARVPLRSLSSPSFCATHYRFY